jgi:hypothetical protein
MTFRRTKSIFILLILSILYLIFGLKYLDSFTFRSIAVLILMFIFYLISTYYKIENGLIIKHSILLLRKEFKIKEIELVEAARIRRAGVIYIRKETSFQEDYYILHFKNNLKIKIDSKYTYRGSTLGQRVIKEYKVPLKETEKMKYLSSHT